MPARHIYALDDRAFFLRQNAEHFAALAFILAGEDDHAIALADFKLRRHHNTSGASEMIFIWFLARSSRGTGPKMRVPTGSPCALISTAALRSKRIVEPS